MPQLEVLKITDLFICHGGLNSVSEALYFGVPMLSIPQANDQPMVTRQIEELGVGIGLKIEDVTPDMLLDNTKKIIGDNKFKSSCKIVRESFIEAGGFEQGVDYILSFTNKRMKKSKF